MFKKLNQCEGKKLITFLNTGADPGILKMGTLCQPPWLTDKRKF